MLFLDGYFLSGNPNINIDLAQATKVFTHVPFPISRNCECGVLRKISSSNIYTQVPINATIAKTGHAAAAGIPISFFISLWDNCFENWDYV